MVEDSKPAKRKPKLKKVKKGNSVEELTFSYAYTCLQEYGDQFLGFTLSHDYVPVHKSRSEELSNLRYYFPLEVLQAVVVWSVHSQREPVIRWTEREALQAYLKANSVS